MYPKHALLASAVLSQCHFIPLSHWGFKFFVNNEHSQSHNFKGHSNSYSKSFALLMWRGSSNYSKIYNYSKLKSIKVNRTDDLPFHLLWGKWFLYNTLHKKCPVVYRVTYWLPITCKRKRYHKKKTIQNVILQCSLLLL